VASWQSSAITPTRRSEEKAVSTFVLIPGAWLGAWAWEATAADLRRRGHDVRAVTLTGLADRAGEATPDTNLTTHIDDVVSLFEKGDLSDAILVGHSYGGAVVTGVADRVPERIARLVYVAGVVLPNGASLFDVIGPEAKAGMEASAAAAGDPFRLPVIGRAELDLYYGAHGVDGALFEVLASRGTPHPIGTYRERLSLANRTAATIDRTYVRATADAWSPITRETPGWDYVEIETGHWPMFTKPLELAAFLDACR
jgi:pimeloyl-ACP methyl ester carboxylesterase